MFLTSPLIEQAISLTTRSMSVIAILRQLGTVGNHFSIIRTGHRINNFYPKTLERLPCRRLAPLRRQSTATGVRRRYPEPRERVMPEKQISLRINFVR